MPGVEKSDQEKGHRASAPHGRTACEARIRGYRGEREGQRACCAHFPESQKAEADIREPSSSPGYMSGC
jgi:hypothetical protein